MEVKPGYKQTEVGVIPEEWDVRTLRSCLSAQPDYGINASAVPFSDRLPAYIRITDITEEGRFSSENPVSVKRADTDSYYLNDGDIVFARTGASVGKSYLYEPKDGKLVFAGFLIRVRPDAAKLLPSYLSAYVTTGAYWNWVRLMSMRSGQPGINGHEYGQLPVPLPSLREQRAIAGALSDVDALIGGMDQLIAKTRDLKQAAMQQLLTGQTRLPGFHGEWKSSTVGSEFNIQLGKMLDSEKNQGVPKPYLGNKAVQWDRIDISDLPTVPMSRADLERYRLERGDLLVCEGGEVGRAAIWEAPIAECYYQKALHRLRPLRGFNSRFMVALLRYWSDQGMLSNYVTQTSIAHLTREKLATIPMRVPQSHEQTAIAEVLTDMDAELAALEQRRDKTRALKQGMMQELLTGRTRLR